MQQTYAMNNDCAGATENRQIQQSVTLAFPLALYDAAATDALFSDGASPRSSVSCLRAFLLGCQLGRRQT